MTCGHIDLVYAWCDDTDPKWRAKRLAVAGRYGVADSCVQNGACRFRGGDMLRYSLRSAAKNAPWIRTVFVLMDDDQTVPDWPELKGGNIRVVRHSEIMPPECLPTFCADVFEHHLARIPGLAERFLYANDDTLFWDAVAPSFFFAADGYPVLRFGMRRKNDADAVEQTYRSGQDVSDGLLRARFGMRPGPRSTIGRLPHHNVDAYLRDDMLACYDCFREAIEPRLRYPFRNHEIPQRVLYSGYAMAVGHGHFRRATFNTNVGAAWWRRLLPSWADSLQIVSGRWREAPKLFARFHPKLVCFNDGIDTTDGDFAWLREYLDSVFPPIGSEGGNR